MLLDVCLGNRTTWKILLLMAEAPGKALTRKQIQEHTRIGNKVLVKFLLLLKKFDIMQETKLGRQFLYKLNMANPYAISILDIIRLEKRQLNNPDLKTAIVLREFVYGLTNLNIENIQRITLFGSVAKHTATLTSDIDIAIVLQYQDPKLEIEITAICKQLEERFQRNIQPQYFTEKEFRQKSKLVEEIKKDGVQLL